MAKESEVKHIRNSLDEGMQSLEDILGIWKDKVLAGKKVKKLSRVGYQSEFLRNGGFVYLPQIFGTSDRSLWNVEFTDRSRAGITHGKLASKPRNPFEYIHASAGTGLDLRPYRTLIYLFDGQNTITEIDKNKGTITTARGDLTLFHIVINDALLDIGKLVEVEKFV